MNIIIIISLLKTGIGILDDIHNGLTSRFTRAKQKIKQEASRNKALIAQNHGNNFLNSEHQE